MQKKDLETLYSKGFLGSLDYHFGAFITRLAGKDDPHLFLAAALVSKHTGEGHVCFNLASVTGKELLKEEDGGNPISCPPVDLWRERVKASGVVGSPGEYYPLILDSKLRLYLYRYWAYENGLAEFIRNRCLAPIREMDRSLLRDGLSRYFPDTASQETDWQKVAALTSATRRLCIISGGPGTGKTSTVARILALILELAGGSKLRIALAAPTGKAAVRLQEAIKEAKNRLDCSDAVKECIPENASTLHRLLGTIPGSPAFRHNLGNPLPADVVVVDEASMVDLALMAKLVSALGEHTRLILLGDKDQLASVEAGAVLGDICDTGRPHDYSGRALEILYQSNAQIVSAGPVPPAPAGIQDCIVELRRSYRFDEKSGIGALSRAIKEGDGDRAVSLLKNGDHQDIAWMDLPSPDGLALAMNATFLRGFSGPLQSSTLDEMIHAFDGFRILCALRKGPYGVMALNALVEGALLKEKLIQRGAWYHGRPIMITTNDYNLKLYNGDIGFILPGGWCGPDSAPERPSPTHSAPIGEMRAFFPAEGAPARTFPTPRLPQHETVFATTVHKSQGSEFDEVHLLLSHRESPVLTRELLYTGVTRARKKVVIWGLEGVFRTAVSRRVERSSGLRDAIWDS